MNTELYWEILGITGLVGAGRTEMCETLFGLSKADSGQVILNGKKVSFSNSSEAVKEGFAFVPESRQTEGLVLENNVEENITINILDQLVGKLSIVDKKQRSEKAKEYINMLNVKPPYPEMQVSKLSGGNQQKIVIAKWVATQDVYKRQISMYIMTTPALSFIPPSER